MMPSMNDPVNRDVLVFNKTLELPVNERASYLSETCDGDIELRRRIEALLEAHQRAGAFLHEVADPTPAGLLPPVQRQLNARRGELAPLVEACGDHVGRYKLLQQIGEGGCGIVYMAEQEEPVRRRVALKVIKLGMDTKQVITRFEAERQALAMMDHPNIAKVFDAGATETGRPYFVMELVRGVKVTDFCDENQVSTEERLNLFIQVCHALQHAHQKGIIHRDIKPTNILVPVDDGVPVPKVIDFGIAKATQGKLTDQTLFTAFEQFIGTPAYVSPEQAVMTNVEVDTRSDIYSLGVLLYELLTGQTPFRQKDLLSSGLDEMRRTIREKDPVRPSTRLKAMVPSDLTTVAKNRGLQPPQLIRRVRGDLDWIVMKCLQKDRARRYETASELAMDVERHLHHQPVLARPDSQAYRVAKFVRRHRAAVTFASLIVVALIAGLTGTITQARRATQHARLEEAQRRRADEAARAANQQRDFAFRQLSRAEAINDLNWFLLSDAAPAGKPFTVGHLLAQAERVIDQQTGEPDDNRVELLIAIGQQYELQDQHAKARDLLGKAYTLSRKLSEASIRAKAAAALAVPVALGGECERGEALIQEALSELGQAPHFVLHRVDALQHGGRVARECGHEQLGLERVRQAQKILDESGQSTPTLRCSLAMSLAESYRMTGRHREAVSEFAAAFQQLSALGRGNTEQAGTFLNNWAVALDTLGQQFEAEKLYRRAVEISTADGTNASVSPMLLNNLARSLNDLYRFDEAANYAQQASEKAKLAGNEHVLYMCRNVQTSIYRQLGDWNRASEALADLETQTAKLLPPGHVAFAIVRSQKSQLALAQGDLQRALEDANEALAVVEKNPAVRDRLPILLLRRAQVHLAAKQFEAARADAARAVALNQEMLGTEMLSSWSGLAHLTIARAFQAERKRAEARSAYASALRHLRAGLGSQHPETVAAAQGIADSER
jgi:serine/threonine protein kinase/tetratricopeptide (TPR) repeat protein